MNQLYTTFFRSPAGVVKIGADEDYICEVSFCGNDEEITSVDEEKLPAHVKNCCKQLEEYFEGSRKTFGLPLRQAGTEFQQSVWKELLSIPFGSTISYRELSKRLGNIKVIRAAASTNGKNRIAIIIPCHRVIGANREMVGYAAGIPIKKWLLEHELKLAHGMQTLF